MIGAARKHGRIVQSGIQLRSDRGLPEAFEWLREGNLGRITLSRGLCYENRSSIGKVDRPTPIPGHIDYDLWCGPAPRKPLMRRKLHGDWHWVWNTVHVIARGNNFRFYINDTLASEFTEHLPAEKRLHKGMIQLQLHDPGMVVHFRDIRLKLPK